MSNSNSQVKRKRDRMDGETAMAFASHQFEQLHPQKSCPEWLPRCTSIGYFWDEDDNYVVSFAVTPKSTNDAVCYFRVSVDPTNGSTSVLIDLGWSAFAGNDLHGY